MLPWSKKEKERELQEEQERILAEQQETSEDEAEDQGEFTEEQVDPAKQASSISKRKVIAVGAGIIVLTVAAMTFQYMEKKQEITAINNVPSSAADKMGNQELDYQRLVEIERGKQANTKDAKNRNGTKTENQGETMQQTTNQYASDGTYTAAGASGGYAGGASYSPAVDDGYITSGISFGVLNAAASPSGNAYAAQAAIPAQKKSLLTAGTTIPVTLLTGITSKLSGEVIAQVRQDVYDSLTGTILLIPAGAKLIGSYSEQSEGRISIAFRSMIMPDTKTIELNSARAIDGIGFSGVKDKYTEHTGRAIGAAAISAAISALAGSGNSGAQSDKRSAGQEARDEAIANTMNTINKIVDKKLEAAPTATVRPGFQFNVFLSADLALPEYWR